MITVVRVRHMREVKFCMSGCRNWFATRGWDWNDFLAHGRPVQDFIATGDPLAARVVEAALRETSDGR